MALRRGFAALAVASLAQNIAAWNIELPPCLSPFQPFVYSGCYADVKGEALSFRSTTSSDAMTIAKCVAECKGNGYRYAGLEYGGICYCGQTVNGASLTEDKCNFGCNGNKTEMCGGDHSLSIYTDPTFPPSEDVDIEDYVNSGCWTDDSSLGRTLAYPQDQVASADMTPEKCLGACEAGGYPFAGVEYGGECWCGVVIGNNTQSVSSDQCNMPCNGDQNSTCGGPGRIQIYIAKDLESLEPCGYVPSQSSSVVSSTTSTTSSAVSSTVPVTTTTTSTTTTATTATSTTKSSTTSSTTTSCPSTTSTTKPGTTTKPATTTTAKPITSTTTSAICTTTYTVPPQCEYGCGKWCNKPLPDWTDTNNCKDAYNSCKMQVASCFKNAQWPGAMDCWSYSSWCENINKYCGGSNCRPGSKGACGKSDCYKWSPPKGWTPPKTTTSTYPCPVTTTKATSTTKTTTTTAVTSCVPSPTNICQQPSNWWYGYGPGKPVGGIELPVLTCNDIKNDWWQKPFKLYTEADSRKCGGYTRPQVPNACADACKEQYDDCNAVYAEGCRQYNHWKRAGTVSSAPEIAKRTFWNDNWNGATNKCKAQYNDCLAVNKWVNANDKCKAWNSGW